MDKKTPITDFDFNTTPWMIQMAKAALPFFDSFTQLRLSVLIRFFEFRCTIEYFNNEKNVYQCNSTHKGIDIPYIIDLTSNQDFLNCISPYCPPMIFNIIKNYKAFSSMSDIFKSSGMNDNPFNLANTGNSSMSGSMNDPSSIFMANMSKEQQKLYDEYLKQLDNIII